jgi:hypothetical protein
MGMALLQTFSATGSNRYVNEERPCECIWGQVVPTVPSPQSSVIRRSMSGSKGSLLMGPI